MIYFSTLDSPVGQLTIAASDNKLIGLWIKDQKYHGNEIFKDMVRDDSLDVFAKTKNWLNGYFAGKNPNPSELPLSPIGSDFRQDVWKILNTIPYGQIVTYGDIGKQIANKRNKKKMSCQAIGGAVGHNPIAIIIPCHRVVGTNKSLTGFASGLDVKKHLLKLEGVDMMQFKN